MGQAESTTERHRRLAEEFEAGDETRHGFAGRHGISVHTLDYHRRRLRETRTRSRIVPVKIVAPEPALPRACLILSSGRRIEFAQPLSVAQFSSLVRLAEQS